MLRTRARYTETLNGTAVKNRVVMSGSNAPFRTSGEVTVDEVAPGDNRIFRHDKYNITGGQLYLDGNPNKLERYARDYYIYWQRLHAGAIQHYPSPDIASNGAYAAMLAARTNPSKAYVDIPVFSGELLDVSELFKFASKVSAKAFASAFLNGQFGWAPLISDLMKIANLADAFHKREKRLRQLHSIGLRSTLDLGEFEHITEKWITLESNITLVQRTVKYHTKSVVRGHVRWVPDYGKTYLPGDPKLIADAKTAVLGLTFDVNTAWQLMPFSWLADWFISLGDLFSAKRNIVGAHIDSMSIMKSTSTKMTADGSNALTPIKNTLVSETRDVVSPKLDAYLPIFSGRQMSILGSVALLQGRAPHRN